MDIVLLIDGAKLGVKASVDVRGLYDVSAGITGVATGAGIDMGAGVVAGVALAVDAAEATPVARRRLGRVSGSGVGVAVEGSSI